MTFRDTFLSAASPTVFIALLLSFVKSASDLIQDNNRRGISVVPYLTLLANCSIWTMYAIMKHDAPVLVANFVGLCCGAMCTAIFHMYSVYPADPWFYALTALAIFTGIYLAYTHKVAEEGKLAMVLSICIYGAPLVTLSKVMQERSTQSMPFLISLGNFVSSMSWTLYGRLVVHDPNITIPSAVGWALASVQMACFLVYGFEPPPRHQITLQRENNRDLETTQLKGKEPAEEEGKTAPGIYYQRT